MVVENQWTEERVKMKKAIKNLQVTKLEKIMITLWYTNKSRKYVALVKVTSNLITKKTRGRNNGEQRREF